MRSTSPYARSRAAQAHWARLDVAERAERLRPAAQRLAEGVDQFADLIHEENGKPKFEAVAHEVSASIGYLRWLLSEAPELLQTRGVSMGILPHRKAEIQRVPWGTVLIIGPWNVPLFIPLAQVASALVAGNAVVLKPSEVTPRCAEIIAEVFGACDLPEGLLQVLGGDGSVGAKLIRQKPDKVLFTGSVATGRKVMAACARHPIPVTLELGGIDAMIVCDDADLEFASSAAAWGATFNGGQVCASVERLIVQDSIRERFLSLVADKLERINVHEDLGPMTFDGQRAVYDAHLQDARERGLEFPTGGRWLGERHFAPTLVTGEGAAESALWCEETFGPMVVAVPFGEDADAVRLHNSVPFGLTASVFTRDASRARAIASELRVGMVSVNEIAATLFSQPELPWGGVGASGFGRSHGAEGLVDCTWPRVVEQARMPGMDFKRLWWYPYGPRQEKTVAALGRSLAPGERLKQWSHLAEAGMAAVSALTGRARL